MPLLGDRSPVHPFHRDSRTSSNACSLRIKRVRSTSYNRWNPPRAVWLPSITSFLFSSTTEAAILATRILTEALVAAAAANAVRNQQVAEFITVAGTEAHAATIAASAMEEEEAQAAQAAA